MTSQLVLRLWGLQAGSADAPLKRHARGTQEAWKSGRGMEKAHGRHARSMQDAYKRHARSMRDSCEKHGKARETHARRMRDACEMHARYTRDEIASACKRHTRCMQEAYEMHATGTRDAHTSCMQQAHEMHAMLDGSPRVLALSDTSWSSRSVRFPSEPSLLLSGPTLFPSKLAQFPSSPAHFPLPELARFPSGPARFPPELARSPSEPARFPPELAPPWPSKAVCKAAGRLLVIGDTARCQRRNHPSHWGQDSRLGLAALPGTACRHARLARARVEHTHQRMTQGVPVRGWAAQDRVAAGAQADQLAAAGIVWVQPPAPLEQ